MFYTITKCTKIMETLICNELTNTKVRELIIDLPFIDTTSWNWNYDVLTSYIVAEEEILIKDRGNNEYFLNIEFDLEMNNEGYFTKTEMKLISIWDSESNELQVTEKQNDIILTALVDLIK